MISIPRLIGAGMVIAATAFGGCGDDDSTGPAPGPDLGDLPIGTMSMTVVDGDAPIPLLDGGWIMEIQGDGDMLVTHESAGGIVGELSVNGDEMTMRDTGGALACEEPNTEATYTWAETSTTVTFSVVSDGCDGRRFVMLYSPWAKQ